MTIYATTWAWQQETANPGQRLVLLAMADNAAGPESDEPGLCWPSIDLIAAKCHLSTRQVKRHLADLHEAGLVVKMQRRRRRDGSLSVWEYLVPYQGTPTSPRPDDRENPRGHPRSTLGDTHGKPKGTPMSPQEEPSCEPPVEPSLSSSLAVKKPASTEVAVVDEWEAQFERFWYAYPRRIGRPAAKTKFRAKMRTANAEQFDNLHAGTARWVNHWRAIETDIQFIPHPTTFLNQERYNDMPPTHTAPKPASAMDVITRLAGRDDR